MMTIEPIEDFDDACSWLTVKEQNQYRVRRETHMKNKQNPTEGGANEYL